MPPQALDYSKTPRHIGLSFPLLCLWCSAFMLLQSCTAPVGTTHVYSVNDDAPRTLTNSLKPVPTTTDDPALIYQTNEEHQQKGDDVFAIYLTDSYLKYLRDVGGLNEVLIVAEFTEAVTGDPKRDTVVKILGPYTHMADATKPPLLNKLIYGPKRMESNILSLKLQVYEYDRGENEDNAAMLDFVSASADSLGLGNPVTLAEMAVAKEIGKALIAANDNDLVMTIDMDFVAGSSNMNWAENRKVNTLPLKAGEMVLVKQEACRVGTCFDYFNQDGSNKLGYIADAVMLAPTAVMRTITDVADHNALTDVNSSSITSTSQGLYQGNPGKAYKDKTWLRLAIVKGGDASHWDQRKQLWEVEADVNSLIRQKVALDATKVRQLGEKLQDVMTKSKALTAPVVFNAPHAINSIQYLQAQQTSYSSCIRLPVGSENVSVVLPNFTLKPTGAPVGYHCFTIEDVSKTVIPAGEHLLEVRYQHDGAPKATHLPIRWVEKPNISAPNCTIKAGEGATISAVVSQPELALKWTLYGQNYPFTHNAGTSSLLLPELPVNTHQLTLTTVVGEVTTSVTCQQELPTP